MAWLALAVAGSAAAAGECPAVNYSCEAAGAPIVARAGRSTVMLKVPGAYQCTGILINNGRNDGRPFVLTARHCAGDGDLDEAAAAVEIVYDHELPCGGTASTQTVSTFGAIHRASYEDVWLIEALDAPPVAADAYYSGFNAGSAYGSDYFGVHHGNGRAKQFVEQRVTSGNLLYLVTGLLGWVSSTWHTDLLSGSTPHGSSGSALFDADGRVFGVLSGGSICAGDSTGNDYQQLATAWEGDGTPDTALKRWLDPQGVGFRQLDGRWPEEAGETPAAPGPGGSASSGSGASGGGAFPALGLLFVAVVLRVVGVRSRRRSLLVRKQPARL